VEEAVSLMIADEGGYNVTKKGAAHVRQYESSTTML
jgi:hypothetical protein